MITQNLPAQPTPFVGRVSELNEIAALLSDSDCHLLTLIGPGGIGKTRLALEIAQLSTVEAASPFPTYPDGVYFIPLQSVTSPDLIASTIAVSAGFQFYQGADPTGQLLDYLRNKSLLLVLDNVEHLLAGVDIISNILAAAPGVRIVATSRETLNLQEEWLYPVAGMPFPEDDRQNHLEDFSAIQLFVHTARRIHAGFSLEAERAAVIRICSLVGGMPLGIEQAASWVRVLSCAEIADEIQRGLDILETSARNVPERHRSMRVVLDHSWKLLDNDEQCVLQWLSVFRGGFTRDAAEQVAGATPRLLSALVDKSWLQRNTRTGRYDLHDLLRQYAEERLLTCGELEQAREGHSRYFAGFMREREQHIKYRRQDAALVEIQQDFPNVRTAWHWAVERCHPDLVNDMAEALNFFCDMRAYFVEGEQLFRLAATAFAASDDPAHRLAYYRLRTRQARLILLGSITEEEGLEKALVELKEIVGQLENLGEPVDIAFALYILGMVQSLKSGLSLSALADFERSFHVYAERQDLFYMAELLVWITLHLENLELAEKLLYQVLDIQEEINDRNGMGWVLLHLGSYAHQHRRYTESEELIQRAIAVQRERGDLKGLFWSLTQRSVRALGWGGLEQANAMAEEALKIASSLNLLPFRQAGLGILGFVRIVTEADYDSGIEFCEQSLSIEVSRAFGVDSSNVFSTIGLGVAAYHKRNQAELRRRYKQLIQIATKFEHDDNDMVCLANLAGVAMLLLDSTGHTEQAVEVLSLTTLCSHAYGQIGMTFIEQWPEQWPVINRLREEWRARLGTAAFTAAWERGTTLDINQTVRWLMAGLEDNRQPMPQVSNPTPAQPPTDSLTVRELEVLQLVAQGHSNREIARQLVLALGTVKWYISEIFSKLGVTSRTQAAARARELNLLQ